MGCPEQQQQLWSVVLVRLMLHADLFVMPAGVMPLWLCYVCCPSLTPAGPHRCVQLALTVTLVCVCVCSVYMCLCVVCVCFCVCRLHMHAISSLASVWLSGCSAGGCWCVLAPTTPLSTTLCPLLCCAHHCETGHTAVALQLHVCDIYNILAPRHGVWCCLATSVTPCLFVCCSSLIVLLSAFLFFSPVLKCAVAPTITTC